MASYSSNLMQIVFVLNYYADFIGGIIILVALFNKLVSKFQKQIFLMH